MLRHVPQSVKRPVSSLGVGRGGLERYFRQSWSGFLCRRSLIKADIARALARQGDAVHDEKPRNRKSQHLSVFWQGRSMIVPHRLELVRACCAIPRGFWDGWWVEHQDANLRNLP